MKVEKFLNRNLTTMTIEINITKCEKSFSEIMKLISKIEQKDLINNSLEVKDIYFK